MNTQTVYDIITNRIIEQLEQGNIPWKKPWVNPQPRNLVTKSRYNGINFLLLSMLDFPSEYFLSYKQAQALGGQVRKGEKSTPVIFWKKQEYLDRNDLDKNGLPKLKTFPLLRYYNVFNLSQIDGIKAPEESLITADPIQEAENLVAGYQDRPSISYDGIDRAFYRPSEDGIHLPRKDHFKTVGGYYSTLFHELVHSTGHDKRLARHTIEKADHEFGSPTYSKEELVAEFGSAFLCAYAKIDNSQLENSSAYIQSWLHALKNDNKLLIQASSQGARAVKYIKGELKEIQIRFKKTIK